MSEDKEQRVFVYNRRLAPIGLFATYDTYAELQEYAARYHGSEAMIAQLFIGLTHNTASAIMGDALLADATAHVLNDQLRLDIDLSGEGDEG